GSETKALISSSRAAIRASVGVCTRPSETAPSKELRRRIVAARVAFMPTIQSASERERAACSSSSKSEPGRSAANAFFIAGLVIDAPALVLGVVLIRFGQLHEVPDGPRDHVLGSLQMAVLLLERPRQHAREVLADGRLLGYDQRLGHGGRVASATASIAQRRH